MEIVKVTKERMAQILPQNVKDSELSINAKKVLAAIINYHLVNEKVRTTKFLAINNNDLRESSCIGKDYLRSAIQELIECKLIDRKVGKKWTAGEKSQASEYRLNLENLKKPITKPTSEELLDMLFSTPSEPLCIKDSPTNTVTNTISNTVSDTNTKTDTTSNTKSETVIETKTEIKKNNILNTMNKFKELKEYINKQFDNCKTYQESVSKISSIYDWINERYSDSSNVEPLMDYANELINKKLSVYSSPVNVVTTETVQVEDDGLPF